MQSHLAYGLIPARGGSAGVPGKNLRGIHGRPLIAYIIDAAKRATRLERVYVSTEDERIATVARECGAKVIRHPADLSTDDAATFGVVRHALGEFRRLSSVPDVVVMMRATSPLCVSDDIDTAVMLLSSTPTADSVTSLVRSDIHPYRILEVDSEGYWKHYGETIEEDHPMQRQRFSPVYVRNGAIYAVRSPVIDAGSLWGRKRLAYIMPKERSINVNDEIDFVLAQALLSQRS